jgi:hypothetical protein
MKQRTLLTILFSLTAILGSTLGFADNATINAGCSVATLNGLYGFYREGTTPDGPLAAVGTVNFDGKGNVTVRQRVSRNGHHNFATFNLTIKVAPDCTFANFTEDGGQLTRGVIVDNGNRFFLLSMTQGNTVYQVAEKIQK